MTENRLARKFATNKAAETLGILYEEIDDDGPIFHVRIARLGPNSKKYHERLGELMKPYRRMKNKDIPEKAQEKAFLQAFCDTTIIPGTWETWVATAEGEGITLDTDYGTFYGKWVPGIQSPINDQILPATAENYYTVLEQLSELKSRLLGEATEFDNYRAETREIEAKNF